MLALDDMKKFSGPGHTMRYQTAMHLSERSLSAYHVVGRHPKVLMHNSINTTREYEWYSHLRDREAEAWKDSVMCLNSLGWAAESASLPTLSSACPECSASNPRDSRAGSLGFLSLLSRPWLAGDVGEGESWAWGMKLGPLPEKSWLCQILRSTGFVWLFGLSSCCVSPSAARRGRARHPSRSPSPASMLSGRGAQGVMRL